MRCERLAVLALVSSLTAGAGTYQELDTTADTPFWRCTGHVNPTFESEPGTFSGSLDTVLSAADDSEDLDSFESRFYDLVEYGPIRLDSRPPQGAVIIIR